MTQQNPKLKLLLHFTWTLLKKGKFFYIIVCRFLCVFLCIICMYQKHTWLQQKRPIPGNNRNQGLNSAPQNLEKSKLKWNKIDSNLDLKEKKTRFSGLWIEKIFESIFMPIQKAYCRRSPFQCCGTCFGKRHNRVNEVEINEHCAAQKP